MKKVVIVFVILIFASATVFARGGGGHFGGGHRSGSHSSIKNSSTGGSHRIRGYVKKNGTYVAPSHATNLNHSKYDNWSTKGNVNPYTGKEGTKDPSTKH